jgi:hypothetical protein
MRCALAVACVLVLCNVSRGDFDATAATSAAKPETQANKPGTGRALDDFSFFVGYLRVLGALPRPDAKTFPNKLRPANLPSQPGGRILYNIPHL